MNRNKFEMLHKPFSLSVEARETSV
jgi:hypothetical protein